MYRRNISSSTTTTTSTFMNDSDASDWKKPYYPTSKRINRTFVPRKKRSICSFVQCLVLFVTCILAVMFILLLSRYLKKESVTFSKDAAAASTATTTVASNVKKAIDSAASASSTAAVFVESIVISGSGNAVTERGEVRGMDVLLRDTDERSDSEDEERLQQQSQSEGLTERMRESGERSDREDEKRMQQSRSVVINERMGIDNDEDEERLRSRSEVIDERIRDSSGVRSDNDEDEERLQSLRDKYRSIFDKYLLGRSVNVEHPDEPAGGDKFLFARQKALGFRDDEADKLSQATDKYQFALSKRLGLQRANERDARPRSKYLFDLTKLILEGQTKRPEGANARHSDIVWKKQSLLLPVPGDIKEKVEESDVLRSVGISEMDSGAAGGSTHELKHKILDDLAQKVFGETIDIAEEEVDERWDMLTSIIEKEQAMVKVEEEQQKVSEHLKEVAQKVEQDARSAEDQMATMGDGKIPRVFQHTTAVDSVMVGKPHRRSKFAAEREDSILSDFGSELRDHVDIVEQDFEEFAKARQRAKDAQNDEEYEKHAAYEARLADSLRRERERRERARLHRRKLEHADFSQKENVKKAFHREDFL